MGVSHGGGYYALLFSIEEWEIQIVGWSNRFQKKCNSWMILVIIEVVSHN